MVTFKDGDKCAAIIIRSSTNEPVSDSFIVGLPYRHPSHSDGFAIHGPLPLSSDPPADKLEDWMDLLFEGFETENPKLWTEYFEELPE